MKKILFILFFILFGISASSYGQIYSKIEKYDKFDNKTQTQIVKTLVNIYQDYIVIETQNQRPKKYYVIYSSTVGDVDNLIDLTGKNVYGYESDYLCVEEKDTAAFNDLVRSMYDVYLESLIPGERNPLLDAYLKVKDQYNDYYDFLLEKIFKFAIAGTYYGFIDNADKEEFRHNYPFLVSMVNRVVSKLKFSFEFDNQYFWINKNNGSRIIYCGK